jgi:hypothetical protein
VRYIQEAVVSESVEQIVDGIVDPNEGTKYSHIEHQIVEEATGDFEFRGGGTSQEVDTSVHVRYRDNNDSTTPNPAR